MRLAYLAEDHGALDPADEARIRRDLPGYYRRHLNGDLTAFVAREGDELVGCALLLLANAIIRRIDEDSAL